MINSIRVTGNLPKVEVAHQSINTNKKRIKIHLNTICLYKAVM